MDFWGKSSSIFSTKIQISDSLLSQNGIFVIFEQSKEVCRSVYVYLLYIKLIFIPTKKRLIPGGRASMQRLLVSLSIGHMSRAASIIH